MMGLDIAEENHWENLLCLSHVHVFSALSCETNDSLCSHLVHMW